MAIDDGVKILICLTFSLTSNVNSVTVTYNAALKRPSFQSSVYTDSHPASLANDGHRSTCSVTQRETTPWWAVDLGGPTTVARVDLINSPEHGDASNNFIVGLTDVHPLILTPTLWNYTLCGQYPGAVPAGATVSLHCPYNLPPFRYVIVQFPLRHDQMRVCEIEVFARVADEVLRNVALNKPSFQISTYDNHSANLANDGDLYAYSYVESLSETYPWWAVDLGNPTIVYQINFTNTAQPYAYHRSNNFIIGLMNIRPLPGLSLTLWNYHLCGQYPGAVREGATVSLFCASNLPASRYVVVQFPIIGQMNFCELQVFAFEHNPILRNEARSKPANQISIFTDSSGSHTAGLANDGSRNTSYAVCAISKVETNPWWTVDLTIPTVVCLVKLTNIRDTDTDRAYRSNEFIVGLSHNLDPDRSSSALWRYTLCGQYPGVVYSGRTVTVQCTNVCERQMPFKYVIVQFPLINDQINFCEIEVYAIVPDLTNVTVNTTAAAECHCQYYSSTVALAVFSCILVVVMVILQVLLLRKRCAKPRLRLPSVRLPTLRRKTGAADDRQDQRRTGSSSPALNRQSYEGYVSPHRGRGPVPDIPCQEDEHGGQDVYTELDIADEIAQKN